MDERPSERPLRAGELARLTGVSKDTLRFYEREGLLSRPERLPNNYRVYPPGTVEHVLWIRRILAAGFTVEELSRILAERGARVRIVTADPAALEAVHAFLRAQIEDHRTGDPSADRSLP